MGRVATIARDIRHADGDGRSRVVGPDQPAVDLDGPTAALVDADDRARRLPLTGPQGTHQPDDLTLVHGERHIPQPGGPEVGDLEHRISGRSFPLRVERLDVSAEHHRYEAIVRRPRTLDLPHQLAVAQHGDAVADHRDLIEPMRDIDDGNALASDVADGSKEDFDLVRAERGRRLVEDEDRGGHRQGASRSPPADAGRPRARRPVCQGGYQSPSSRQVPEPPCGYSAG